ncbi:SDR family oxidoreductase [Streptomyces sp. NPDC054933]
MTCVRFVTGASGLIGAALTRHLSQLPGKLLAVDTRPTKAAGHPVIGVDATSEQFADLLAAHLPGAERAELYHTAGHVPSLARIADTPTETFDRIVAANLTATYTVLRAFALTARQHQVPAAAVLLSSAGATRAHRYLVAYDAAKAAIESLARSFTLEYGADLAVRAVAVGPVAESATTAADGDRLPALVALVPRGRYTAVADVARALTAFGGPCFDSAAGHTLTLDGGLSVQLRPAAVERPPGYAQSPSDTCEPADTGHFTAPAEPLGGTR